MTRVDPVEELAGEERLDGLAEAHLHEVSRDPLQQHDQFRRWFGGYLVRKRIDTGAASRAHADEPQ